MRSTLRAVLCTALLGVVGSVLVANPAQAAPEEEQHCVIAIADLDRVTCFDTLAKAIDFATGGRGTTPSKGSAGPSTGSSTERFGTESHVPNHVPVATWFRYWLFQGSSVTWMGSNGNCTTPTGNIDYQLSSVPAPYNNWMSSFITYSNCWEDDYDLSGPSGYHTGYRGTQAVVNATIDNDTSAANWS
jgi:hypothetical protein